jgi:ABC-type branched-subunit amino acid transport system substrate-binding protein
MQSIHLVRALALCFCFAISGGMSGSVRAQGVTDKEIIIGQTAGFTGSLSGIVAELTQGAKLYLDWVNENGGVGGRKITLVSLDDGSVDPKRAGDNARQLLAEKSPLAFFLTRATPLTEAVVAVAKESGVPVIAPSTGAMLFHTPVNPLVFNVRAKYQTEVEQAVEYLNTVGINQIAIIYVNDSFGKDGLEGFNRKMNQLKLKPAAVVVYERSNFELVSQAQEIVKASPQAVVLVATGKSAPDVVLRVRKAGNNAQFIALSNNSAKSFVKELGPYARGVMVTQVFPNPAKSSAPIAREMRKLAQSRKDVVLSHTAMEGFAGAKVLVEGLRRAGKTPTRASLIAALEGMRDLDIGGVSITYGPQDHTGAEYVELSIIDANGEFIQ